MADAGFTEIQLLGQNVNSYRDPSGQDEFCGAAGGGGRGGGDSAGAVYDQPSEGLYAGYCGGHRRGADAVRSCASAGAVGVDAGAGGDGAGVYARVVPGADCVDQGGAAGDQHDDATLLSGFRARRRQELEETATLLEEVQYDAVFCFKYSPRPNTPATGMADSIPEEEKSRRLQVIAGAAAGDPAEELRAAPGAGDGGDGGGAQPARGQVVGRSSQNKTVNFTVRQPILPAVGSYPMVRITETFPNSLVGEACGGLSGGRGMKTASERGDRRRRRRPRWRCRFAG